MAADAARSTVPIDALDGGPSFLDVGSWIDEGEPVAAALLCLVIFWLLALRLLSAVVFPEGLTQACDERSGDPGGTRKVSGRFAGFLRALRLTVATVASVFADAAPGEHFDRAA